MLKQQGDTFYYHLAIVLNMAYIIVLMKIACPLSSGLPYRAFNWNRYRHGCTNNRFSPKKRLRLKTTNISNILFIWYTAPNLITAELIALIYSLFLRDLTYFKRRRISNIELTSYDLRYRYGTIPEEK